MITIVVSALSFILGLIFLITGIQFQKGKWLRLLAGNTFGDIPSDKAKKIGKTSSYYMYFAFIFCSVLAYSLLKDNSTLLYFMSILSIIIGGIGICYALSYWVKNG